MCHVQSSLISSLVQWTQSDQDLLDKSSGQTTSSLVGSFFLFFLHAKYLSILDHTLNFCV